MKNTLLILYLILSTMPAHDAGIQIPGGIPPGAVTVCSEGCDYTTIQDAVDAVEAGGMVILGPGSFFENVEVHASGPLTIRGMGPDKTIVDGGDIARVFDLNGESVTIADLTIQHGYDFFLAGGIISLAGNLTIDNCVVRENRSCYSPVAMPEVGGGIFAVGNLTVLNSTISDNTCHGDHGAGIAHICESGDRCVVRLENSLVTGNNGRISAVCEVPVPDPNEEVEFMLINTTVSGNDGIGIDIGNGTLLLDNSTVTENIGVQVRTFSTASLIADHSIVRGFGVLPDCRLNANGAVTLGHNLDGDGSCDFTDPTDLPGMDPMLMPLGEYGGPTLTHALHPYSPAIDAGDTTCLPTDQRGVWRPFDGDLDGEARCDIGAFEFGIRGNVTFKDLTPM